MIPLKESDIIEEEKGIAFEQVTDELKTEREVKKKWGLQVPVKKSEKKVQLSATKPILLKNRLVGLDVCRNETERFSLDLNSRPVEPSEESYSKIPVSEFGAAMLRGMGWKGPDHEDSKNGPIKYVPRPERLGLGASEAQDSSDLKKRRPIEQSLGIEMTKEEAKQMNRIDYKKKQQQPIELLAKHANYIGLDDNTVSKRIKLDLSIGSRIIICEGEHSGLKGIIKGEGKEQKHWIIELKINSQDVKVQKSFVKRYDPVKEAALNTQTEETSRSSNLFWVCSGLKVKIKSKSLFKGQFYNKKGIIVDVQTVESSTIKLLDTNETVYKVPQSALETCLPRAADPSRANVKYLKRDKGGEFFQAPFRVLQFDDDAGRAVIQSEDDFEMIFEAHYDDICEYLRS